MTELVPAVQSRSPVLSIGSTIFAEAEVLAGLCEDLRSASAAACLN